MFQRLERILWNMYRCLAKIDSLISLEMILKNMVLVDKKILGGGIAMVAIGLALLGYLNTSSPLGTADMTDEQAMDLILRQQENRDYTNLAAMLAGVGFLLVLISFGARRRKGGAKKIEKKPPA
jgi:hypothetical protein